MLIGGMICGNEKDRYLPYAIETLKDLCDKIIIVDDCTNDGTYDWIRDLKSSKIKQFRMEKPTFETNELLIRKTLWKEISGIAKKGDSVLILDSDERIPKKDYILVNKFMQGNIVAGIMKLFNMWSWEEYRVDGAWCPSNAKRRLFKYLPATEWHIERLFACGECPKYVYNSSYVETGIRLQHLSYIKPEDRQRKYERYMRIDGGKFHSVVHLQSIVQPPILKKWVE